MADRPVPLELRRLTGPNLYFPRPAIKLTLDATDALAADATSMLAWQRALALRAPHLVGLPGSELRLQAAAALAAAVVRRLSRSIGRRVPVVGRPGDDDAIVVAFPYRHPELAAALGQAAADTFAAVTRGADPTGAVARATQALAEVDPGPVQRPVRAKIPVIAVTGTNGKTTTTRLISHLVSACGRVPGWSSTDGILIDGEVVERGDWSGPGGAARVLSEPRVQVAVTETARGGILLRGIGVAANDVSVVTNISADHLGSLGVHTVEQLAEVKSVVVRITKPTGWAVLNADDDLVYRMHSVTRARIWAYSTDPGNARLTTVVQNGGRAITVRDGDVVVLERGFDPVPVLPVRSIPLTLGGASMVNVSNVLAATAAGLGLGLPLAGVRAGLISFAGNSTLNAGRLNCYLVGTSIEDSTVVILDLAHNEASLTSLLDVGANLRRPGGQLAVIATTAGDRADDAVHDMGALAAGAADLLVVADKEHYLRGRVSGEMVDLWRSGATEAGVLDVLSFANELPALRYLLDLDLPPESVIAATTLEQRLDCVAEIEARGGRELSPAEMTERLAS